MSSSTKAKADPSGQSSATTLDDFLGGRIAVVQPKTGHRAGSDAVWLQAAVPASAKDRVLDAGAGVGVAGLCLAARFPQIKTYAGHSISDPTITTRFDWTPTGFHAIILGPKETVLVEPYAQGNTEYYVAYFQSDVPAASYACEAKSYRHQRKRD